MAKQTGPDRHDRVLLLGGSGFVGGYLSDGLKKRGNSVVPTYSRSVIEGGLRYDLSAHRFVELVSGPIEVIINNINPLNCGEDDLSRATTEIIDYLLAHPEVFYIQISSVSADEHNRHNDPYSEKKYRADALVRERLPEERYAILRFPQLFDYAGKARSSQGGLFYLVESVYRKTPINVFPNYKEMRRNYLPVEILVEVVTETMERRITGLQNILIGHHTLPFSQLLDILLSFNPAYDRDGLLRIGEKSGASYFIPEPSNRFDSLNSKTAPIDGYFKKLYDEYTGKL